MEVYIYFHYSNANIIFISYNHGIAFTVTYIHQTLQKLNTVCISIYIINNFSQMSIL